MEKRIREQEAQKQAVEHSNHLTCDRTSEIEADEGLVDLYES